MPTLYTILIVFEAIVCFLLIGIVLLQKSTGDGNGLSFGSGAESVFGAQTGNILTRGTVVLAVLFLLNTLVLCILRPEARAKSLSEEIVADEAARAKSAAIPADDEAADILGDLDTIPGAVEAVPGAVETAKDAAAEAAATVEEKATVAAEAVKDAATESAATVEEKAAEAAETAKDAVEAATAP